MHVITCKNWAMYIEALRAINAMGLDYEAQPEELSIVTNLEDEEAYLFEAFGTVEC